MNTRLPSRVLFPVTWTNGKPPNEGQQKLGSMKFISNSGKPNVLKPRGLRHKYALTSWVETLNDLTVPIVLSFAI